MDRTDHDPWTEEHKMSPKIQELSHTPNTRIHIKILYDNGDLVNIRSRINKTRVVAKYRYFPSECLMTDLNKDMDADSDGRDAVHDKINDVIAEFDIDDKIDLTLERLRRVGHWMDSQDITRCEDVRIDICGSYKPLRSDQNLYLVRAGQPLPRGGAQQPFVFVTDQPLTEDGVRDRIDLTVQRRSVRSMDSWEESHSKVDPEDICAGEITRVGSVEEANSIVYGDNNPENEDEDSTEQATFKGF